MEAFIRSACEANSSGIDPNSYIEELQRRGYSTLRDLSNAPNLFRLLKRSGLKPFLAIKVKNALRSKIAEEGSTLGRREESDVAPSSMGRTKAVLLPPKKEFEIELDGTTVTSVGKVLSNRGVRPGWRVLSVKGETFTTKQAIENKFRELIREGSVIPIKFEVVEDAVSDKASDGPAPDATSDGPAPDATTDGPAPDAKVPAGPAPDSKHPPGCAGPGNGGEQKGASGRSMEFPELARKYNNGKPFNMKIYETNFQHILSFQNSRKVAFEALVVCENDIQKASNFLFWGESKKAEIRATAELLAKERAANGSHRDGEPSVPMNTKKPSVLIVTPESKLKRRGSRSRKPRPQPVPPTTLMTSVQSAFASALARGQESKLGIKSKSAFARSPLDASSMGQVTAIFDGVKAELKKSEAFWLPTGEYSMERKQSLCKRRPDGKFTPLGGGAVIEAKTLVAVTRTAVASNDAVYGLIHAPKRAWVCLRGPRGDARAKLLTKGHVSAVCDLSGALLDAVTFFNIAADHATKSNNAATVNPAGGVWKKIVLPAADTLITHSRKAPVLAVALLPRLVSLARTCAKISGHDSSVLNALVRFVVDACEVAVSLQPPASIERQETNWMWINSGLFDGGISDIIKDDDDDVEPPDAFLRAMISHLTKTARSAQRNGPGSDAKAASDKGAALLAKLQTDKGVGKIFANNIKKVMAKLRISKKLTPATDILLLIFATLLKFTGLMAEAASLFEKKFNHKSAWKARKNDAAVIKLWENAVAIGREYYDALSNAQSDLSKGKAINEEQKLLIERWKSKENFKAVTKRRCTFLVQFEASEWRYAVDMKDLEALTEAYQHVRPADSVSSLYISEGDSPRTPSPSRRPQGSARARRFARGDSGSPQSDGGGAENGLSITAFSKSHDMVVRSMKQLLGNQDATILKGVRECLFLQRVRGAARLIAAQAAHELAANIVGKCDALRIFSAKFRTVYFADPLTSAPPYLRKWLRGIAAKDAKTCSALLTTLQHLGKPITRDNIIGIQKSDLVAAGYGILVINKALRLIRDPVPDEGSDGMAVNEVTKPKHFLEGMQCIGSGAVHSVAKHYYSTAAVVLGKAISLADAKFLLDVFGICDIEWTDSDMEHISASVLHGLTQLLPLSQRLFERKGSKGLCSAQKEAWAVFCKLTTFAFAGRGGRGARGKQSVSKPDPSVVVFQEAIFSVLVDYLCTLCRAVGVRAPLPRDIGLHGGLDVVQRVRQTTEWEIKELNATLMNASHAWIGVNPPQIAKGHQMLDVVEVTLCVNQVLGLLLQCCTTSSPSARELLLEYQVVNVCLALLEEPRIRGSSNNAWAADQRGESYQLTQSLAIALLDACLSSKRPALLSERDDDTSLALRSLFRRLGVFEMPLPFSSHEAGAHHSHGPRLESWRQLLGDRGDAMLALRRDYFSVMRGSISVLDGAVSLFRSLLCPKRVRIVKQGERDKATIEMRAFAEENIGSFRGRVAHTCHYDAWCRLETVTGVVLDDDTKSLREYGFVDNTVILASVGGGGGGEAKAPPQRAKTWADNTAVFVLSALGELKSAMGALDAAAARRSSGGEDPMQDARRLQGQLEEIYAALAVLGGAVLSLHEGSTVMAMQDGLEARGRITKILSKDGNANVLLDAGTTLTSVGPQCLRAIHKHPLQFGSDAEYLRLISIMVQFLNSPMPASFSKQDVARLHYFGIRRRMLGVLDRMLCDPRFTALFLKEGHVSIIAKLYKPFSGKSRADLEYQFLALAAVPVPQPMPKASSAEWSCAVCTFKQPAANKVCTMCGSLNKNAAGANARHKVSCTRCTFINELKAGGENPKCSTCSQPLVLSEDNRAWLQEQKEPVSGSTSSPPDDSDAKLLTADEPPKVMSDIEKLGINERLEDKDACFLAAALNMPEKWCRDALQEGKVARDPFKAVNFLLCNEFKNLMGDYKTYQEYKNGNDPTAAKPSRLAQEISMDPADGKAPRTNPLLRVLTKTTDRMDASSNDGGDGKAQARARAASVADAKCGNDKYVSEAEIKTHKVGQPLSHAALSRLNRDRYVARRIDIELKLCCVYSRDCVFSLLSNLPKDDPQTMKNMTESGILRQFLGVYLRQLFANSALESPDGVVDDQMAKVFLHMIKTEIKPVVDAAIVHKNTWGNPLPYDKFAEVAPISAHIGQIVLTELTTILRALVVQRERKSADLRAPRDSQRMVTWCLDVLFAGINESNRESMGSRDPKQLRQQTNTKRVFFEFLCSPQLTNVLVELIVATSGQLRNRYMQLLATVINVLAKAIRENGGEPSTKIPVKKIRQLQDLMFKMRAAQVESKGAKNVYSTFFQTLVELNVTVFTTLGTGTKGNFEFSEDRKWFKDLCLTSEVFRGMRSAGYRMPEDFLVPIGNSKAERKLIAFLKSNNDFKKLCDSELVNLVNQIYIKSGGESGPGVKAEDLKLSEQQMTFFPNLRSNGIDHEKRTWRFAVLQEFNQRVRNVVPYINLSLPTGVSALTDGIRACSNIIFWSSKKKLWTEYLRTTENKSVIRRSIANGGYRANQVKVRNSLATEFKMRQQFDANADKTVLGQVYQQLKDKPAQYWRLPERTRAFAVIEVGQMSHDDGGPYRNLFSSIVKDLQGSKRWLRLFQPTPNQVDNIGSNKAAFIPCPIRQESAIELRLKFGLYEFIGKLMGLAIRTRDYLSLNLTSVVWKPLVCAEVTSEDIIAVYKHSFRDLVTLDQLEKKTDGGDAKSVKEFDDKVKESKLRFEVLGSDRVRVQLKPDGDMIPVTWKNRKEYKRLTHDYKLGEFSRQAQAIRRGLATVVPYQYLSIFTWNELENQVCGRAEIDVKLLKSVTRYHGLVGDRRVDESFPHVKLFWRMLEERMDDAQRSELIYFAWGRNRLPASKEEFGGKHFDILLHPPSEKKGASRDQYLPVSHTCYFQLELPRYTSLDIMYEKFLYSMANCKTIEADETQEAKRIANQR